MLDAATIAFQSLLQVKVLVLLFFGVMLGIIIGAIPGLTSTMGVALMIPFTFGMTPIGGIALLVGVYVGGTSGGQVSAILMRMPGTPSSVATTFDGFPMARKGQAGKALGTGVLCSFFGTLVSAVVLILVAPQLARIALKFSAFEYFSISVFAMTMIVSLAGGSIVKALIAACLGFLLSTIGVSPVDGMPRFTFGMLELVSGFDLLPIVIGLFAVPQVLSDIENIGVTFEAEYKVSRFFPSRDEMRDNLANLLRSALIGVGIGILPGIGSSTSNLIAYSEAKRRSKHPEKFGTGIIDGIVASETANNANIGGALIPLLTLGIPGDTVTAMLIGGLMIHGLQPGPMLFHNNPEIVYGVFIALIFASVFMFIQMYWGMRLFVKALKTPKEFLLPLILVFCALGSYALNSRVYDIWVMLAFGLIGAIMEKYEYPVVPMFLGIILGPMLETNYRRALMASAGSHLPFITRPISLLFLLLALVFLVGPQMRRRFVKEPN
ncbi:MAG: tripartite tricarboxylate transporter permease [Limnochordia bacterium]|jgi:putative tricarboxylic transport membrane protein